MNPSLVIDTVASLILAGRNVLIKGSPGIGKTEVVKQAIVRAQERAGQEVGFMYHHGPSKLPEHFGVPVPNMARTAVQFCIPGNFPIEGATNLPKLGAVMWDDAGQLDSGQQKIVANIIQERELHGHAMMPGWVHVMTGNRIEDRAGSNRLLTHLANRLTVITMETHHDDWINWALDNEVAIEVISFIRFKPDMLNSFSPDNEQNATPRSWVEGVSDLIGKLPPAAEFETFKGGVGEGPATEFTAFLKVFRELPDPDAVLMDPDKYPVPTEPSVLFALSGALSVRGNKDNFDRLVNFCGRMPPEFNVRTIKDVIARQPEVTHTRVFSEWSRSDAGKATRGGR